MSINQHFMQQTWGRTGFNDVFLSKTAGFAKSQGNKVAQPLGCDVQFGIQNLHQQAWSPEKRRISSE